MRCPLIKPKYYISLFNEIFKFVKNPKDQRNQEKLTRAKIYDTIGLYLLKLVLLIPLVLFFAVVYNPENVQSKSMLDRFSPMALLVVGGVLLPLLEETAFRLSLRFKPIYLALSSSVFTYYILSKVVFSTKMSAVDESFVLRTAISVLVGMALYPLVNLESVKMKLAKFWSSHFGTIYYLTCLLFAWVHITKYELTLINIVLLPILTLPQLMSALMYGYLRASFGFKYPLLFHMSNNVLAIGLSLLPFSD